MTCESIASTGDSHGNHGRRRLRVVIACVVVVLLLVGLVVVGRWLNDWRDPTIALWEQISLGDSEGSVRDLLGEPYREYHADNAPADYYISGYGTRERPISGKVLIYLGADIVLYIWIGGDGLVEDIYRGVS